MSAPIRFYTNPMSRGRIARWMLEETGVPYETEIMAFGGSIKSEAYKAVNPMGKVPAIVHDGKVVTECAAICLYLADAFPGAGLAPDPADRADYYRWILFAAGPVEAAVTNRALGVDVPPDRSRMVGYGSFGDALDGLEYAVTRHDFIAGKRFTAADVYVGSQIGWGLQFGSLEPRPAFRTYHDRLKDRPAFLRATAIDDADAARMQAAAKG